MIDNIIIFPRARVTPVPNFTITAEQCARLEKSAIAAGDWEQAAFFMRAAITIASEIAQAELANDNIIPLRRA